MPPRPVPEILAVAAAEEGSEACDDFDGDPRTNGLLAALERFAERSLRHAGGPANPRAAANRLLSLLSVTSDTQQQRAEMGAAALGLEASFEIVAEPGANIAGVLKPGDIVLRQLRRDVLAAIVADPEPSLPLTSASTAEARPRQARSLVAVRTLNGLDGFWPVADRFGRAGRTVRILRLTTAGRSMIEHAIGVIEDADLAVPAFTGAERAIVIQPLLVPAANAVAISWNQAQHPLRSGVGPDRIAAALARYVDMAAVRMAIANYNAAHPDRPIAPGTPPVDSGFVEAIYQFQRKVFADPAQHDARAGERVLDSLGLFLGRSGLDSVDVANPTAQQRLHAVRNRLPGANDNPGGALAVTAANWFRHMVAPAFLGETFRNGIHAALIRRLRTAERHLLSRPAYAGMTPVALGAALGLREFHRGARPTATTKSLHTFGLATDINYFGNPWIRGEVFTRALKRARLLVSGLQMASGQISTILHRIGTSGRATAAMYDELAAFDVDFRTYLRLSNDGLSDAISARRADGTPGIFVDPSETDAAAAERWWARIERDLAELRNVPTFDERRDPRDGFLNLHRDLAVALRDVGCLAWGAVDFGPNASGDVMHFDCRTTGLGRIVHSP